ncbi:MAG: hypothetical protein JWO00_36 [Candidatus Parcubacteria bacterium]|nr:hypothetical protein [Candidatus Parcubacteria bacterium]
MNSLKESEETLKKGDISRFIVERFGGSTLCVRPSRGGEESLIRYDSGDSIPESAILKTQLLQYLDEIGFKTWEMTWRLGMPYFILVTRANGAAWQNRFLISVSMYNEIGLANAIRLTVINLNFPPDAL